ncbi:ABC transporter permease [Roseomonas sp. SSH11]|uniref:ABC transporter permease n=1 Tax=Pararoseomonas baculiformis TaxID=2820812 RepID=A0ABS4AIP4_9PROT|nr:ABC transporter permease [Pararoseomonas baculiformis]MBP0446902.1 ABC transporter permease [Pararoseomonas baculiformis]
MSATAAATGESSLKSWLLLAPLLVFLAAFFVVPLAQVVVMSVTEPEFGFGHYAEIVTDGFHLRVLMETFVTALVVSLCCLLLGFPLAYAMAAAPASLAAAMMVVVTMSFWTSFLVRTYAWMVLLGNRGPIAQFAEWLGFAAPELLFTRFSSTIAMTHILLPYMVLSLYGVLKRIEPALPRSAASLGATPAAVIRHVVLPLAAPGIANGLTLVFVLCLGFYVTPILLGSPREQMVAGVIGQQVEEFLAFGEASAMAVVLLASTLIVLGLYHRRFGLDRLWG